MAQQEFCQNCNQKHDCQEVYRRLGSTEGPSVVLKVVAAFLLPIAIFIGALAAFEAIWAGTVDAKELRIALNFLSALSVTFAVVLVIKAAGRGPGEDADRGEGRGCKEISTALGRYRKWQGVLFSGRKNAGNFQKKHN